MEVEILEPRSGVVSGELACGLIGVDGKLHDTFLVKEMTGEEEDVLAGAGLVVDRLSKVIRNCLVSIGDVEPTPADKAAIVGRLSQVDRTILMIAIRRASLGDKLTTRQACPKCAREQEFVLDLSGLEVTKAIEPGVRERKFKLASGCAICWHLMDARDEAWVEKNQKGHEGDAVTIALLARVDQVGDVKIDRIGGVTAALKALKALTLRERNELRGVFGRQEGKVDTMLTYECSTEECEHEFEGELPIGMDFFFPRET